VDDRIAHLAALARLSLREGEAERLAEQLAEVLDYVERLQSVDVDGVEPTAFAGAGGRQRPPGLRIELADGEALESAPDPVAGAFRVPRVVG